MMTIWLMLCNKFSLYLFWHGLNHCLLGSSAENFCKQIGPRSGPTFSHKIGQGQPRIIICTLLVGPTLPVLHTKSKAHQPSGSGEEHFLRVFTIYGHRVHLGHVTITI